MTSRYCAKKFLQKLKHLFLRLGLTDRETEGTWLNSDGTEFTFTDGWAPGQPGILIVV